MSDGVHTDYLASSHLSNPEVRGDAESLYPLLDVSELPSIPDNLIDQLSDIDKAQVREDETVVNIHTRKLRLPANPVTPLEILMKAANAALPQEIGLRGHTVASVDVSGSEEISRYERQHGRDDLIAANDVKMLFPNLLDSVAVSLASTQGMNDEIFIQGAPYGFEKPGSIILVNHDFDDPLGRKFKELKHWKPRFYGSADAPGLFVEAIANLQAIDPSYIFNRHYTAIDGHTYKMQQAFELSDQWLIDRMNENTEGLIEYKNPYTDGKGMRNQGWKDSADAMVHTNGDWVNAAGGVAPIEIQCQTVISLRRAAYVYRNHLGNDTFAAELLDRASALQAFIFENGWVQDDRGGYFAMGWDRTETGQLRRIDTRSIDMHSVLRILDMTNPDHKEMARQTVRTLTSEEMITRWGSRVMSNREVAYGDLRYHCGVWPDKSNRVAETMSAIGLYGIDRVMGQRTANLLTTVGCVPEHISGQDSEAPLFATKDLYVYNHKYKELHLAEQVPPLGQTWGATSELAKVERYGFIPLQAESVEDQQFEQEIISSLQDRYR